MKRHKDFWQVTEESLDKSMKVFGIDMSMKNDLLNLYKILSPYPEVKGVLENLKQKIGDRVKFYNPKIGYFKIEIE